MLFLNSSTMNHQFNLPAAVHLNQGSPNFFVRGPHKLLHSNSRAGQGGRLT